MAGCLWLLAIAGGSTRSASGADQTLPEIHLEAEGVSAVRAGVLGADALQNAPGHALDSVLQADPGFHLFRRADSRTSHPTSQGVSLGNAGPNGASRALVLLDGVPLNDPFGGWIPWSRVPPEWLSSAVLSPDGAPGAPVAGLPGGSILLESRFLQAAPFTLAEVSAGNLVDHHVSLASAQDFAGGRGRVFGGGFSTDYSGYRLVRGGRQGAVDVRAWSRAQGWDGGVRYELVPGEWRLTLRGQGWEEWRGNGTPLARNESGAYDLSARLEKRGAADEWTGEWTLFHQERTFSSTFTSISADRSGEALTLDQYAVPARVSGLLQRVRVPVAGGHVLVFGNELRETEGATHERRYVGGSYASLREAGGRQWDGGLLLGDVWTPGSQLSLTGSARLNLHEDEGGFLKETSATTGAVLPNLRYPVRENQRVDYGLSARWTPAPKIDVESSVFTAHRYPSLNELYRPYRLGNTVTLANPELRPETLLGADLAGRWRVRRQLTLRGRLFVSELRDAIANVSLVNGPGTFPAWGPLPVGGVGARRENLDLVRTRGVEAGSEWEFDGGSVVSLRWIFTDARVVRARVQPSLEGRAPAQLPRHQAVLAVRGGSGVWRWNVGVRAVSSQFDDDQNERSLSRYVCADARIARRFGAHTELFLASENLTDAPIESRRDGDGTVAFGAPRSIVAGVRCEF